MSPGILLALNLPVTINPLISVFGRVIAIVVVKQMFGGIGQNFVNPALTARIILMNSFPARMTHWTAAFDYSATADAVTTATPLGILSEGAGGQLPSYLDMFLGKTGGCLGETCALAILIGGILPDFAPGDQPGDSRDLPRHGGALFFPVRTGSAV